MNKKNALQNTRRSIAEIGASAFEADRISAISIVLLSLLVGVIPGLQVYFTAAIADSLVVFATSESASLDVYWAVAALVLVTLASQIISLAQARAISRCQSRMSETLSSKIILRCLKLTQQEAEDSSIHDSIQRAIREVAFRPGMLISDAAQILTQAVTMLSIGAALLSMNVLIAFLAVLTPIPIIVGQIIQGGRQHQLEYNRAEQRRRVSYWHHLVSQPHTSQELRAFNLKAVVEKKFRTVINEIVSGDLKLSNANFLLMLPAIILSGAIGASAQVLAVTTVERGPAMVATVIAVFQSLGFLQGSMQQLFASLAGLHVSSKFVTNILDFVDLGTTEEVPDAGMEPSRSVSSGLDFVGLNFTYAGSSSPTLSDLNVSFHAGQITALVGVNGSGKSTIAKLIARLYKPQAGHIKWNGIPIESYNMDRYRAILGFVFQEFTKYQMSVLDNIVLDDSGAESRRRCLASSSLRALGDDSFYTLLPNGLDTTLGRAFGETEISGGQWQRLAVARAIARNPQVLVLDEPTSAIDSVTELSLIEHLRENSSNRVTILIAHKASLVRQADRIVVMDDGRVIDDGTHSDLLHRCDEYRTLFTSPDFATTEDSRA